MTKVLIVFLKSNGVDNSKLKSLDMDFLHRTQLSGYKIGIKFNKDTLAVEENNYCKCLYCL